MHETVEVTNRAVDAATHPPTRVLGDISTKLAGVGGIAFAAIVILQNIIRGGSAPANGATSAEVLAHYVDHRPITFGFLIWLAFLVTTGNRLVRSRES